MKRSALFLIYLLLAAFTLASCGAAQPPLAAASPITSLPFEANDHGIIFLKARVDRSRGMSFALDSGASFPFVIDSRRARDLKLKLTNSRTLASGGGARNYDVSDVNGVTIELGDLKFADQPAEVLALDSLESVAGRRLDGLVGQYLFRRYVVEINYVDRVVNLYDPQTFSYKGTGEALPLAVEENYFFVSAKLAFPKREGVDAKLLVDTGGGFITIVLNAPFARSNRLPTAEQRVVPDRSLAGLGGEMRLLVGRGSSLALGRLLIRDPVVYISEDTGGALASGEFDGVLGSQILQKFKAIFDASHGRLILEPNKNYEEPLEYDMSGIRLRAEGSDLNEFRIYQVLENSPAAKFGLKQGDVLTDIDGVPASKLSLARIYEMFKQAGRTLKLTIRRGNQTSYVTLRLERLI